MQIGDESSGDVPSFGRDDQASLEVGARRQGLLDRSNAFGRCRGGGGGVGDHTSDVCVGRKVEGREFGGDGLRRRVGLRPCPVARFGGFGEPLDERLTELDIGAADVGRSGPDGAGLPQ